VSMAINYKLGYAFLYDVKWHASVMARE